MENKSDLAVLLYKEQALSLEKAAHLAGDSIESFIVKLGKQGIPLVNYSPEDLDQEIKDFTKN